MIVALAGGVGAARMLCGLVAVVDPSGVTAVVNTGDDLVLHGLDISPDLDTVTYTLAGAIDPETGWGLAGETWQAMEALRAYSGGRSAWFNLGDRDLGTHLLPHPPPDGRRHPERGHRRDRRRGALGVRLLPMSDDPVETRVVVSRGDGDGRSASRSTSCGRRHAVPVKAVRFDGRRVGAAGARRAGRASPRPTRGDLPVQPDRVDRAGAGRTGGPRRGRAGRRDVRWPCRPSSPARRSKARPTACWPSWARSVGGRGGPPLRRAAATLVIDEADADLAEAVEAEGMRCVVAPTSCRARTRPPPWPGVVARRPAGRRRCDRHHA